MAKSPHLEPGGSITAGEVLLRIDDTDYMLAAEQARATWPRPSTTWPRPRRRSPWPAASGTSIGAAGIGGEEGAEPTPLVLREPQLKLARANLEAAKAALHQAEVEPGALHHDGALRRPGAATPTWTRASSCAAGMAIGSIYATDMAEVTVPVADADLAWITVGHRGDDGVPVDVSAEFAGARHHWHGRAVRLGGAVDQRSRLVPVVVEIPDPYQRRGDRPPLIEGMFVEVEFTAAAARRRRGHPPHRPAARRPGLGRRRREPAR